MATTLHIKNMVCNRCIKVVKEEFEQLNVTISHIELGKVELTNNLNNNQLATIKKVLDLNGFELIDDKKSQLIDRIKTLIIQQIHHSTEHQNAHNLSDLITKNLGYDYSYLSNLFSAVEGDTIERYLMKQKTEKVKELLVYDQLSVKEIAYQLNYSSVQHLSAQFKKMTGMTPSQFKKLKETNRQSLDQV